AACAVAAQRAMMRGRATTIQPLVLNVCDILALLFIYTDLRSPLRPPFASAANQAIGITPFLWRPGQWPLSRAMLIFQYGRTGFACWRRLSRMTSRAVWPLGAWPPVSWAARASWDLASP